MDERLCVCTVLKLYLKVTETLRSDEKQLLISYKKPHGAVSKDTIARWLKTVMKSAGIDVSIYKAHSTRAASTSAADKKDVPIGHIIAAAGWSSEKTFQAWYNKPVDNDKNDFAGGVLQG